jgi:hypothetical protein
MYLVEGEVIKIAQLKKFIHSAINVRSSPIPSKQNNKFGPNLQR